MLRCRLLLTGVVLFSFLCLGTGIGASTANAASSVATLDQLKAAIHDQLALQPRVITITLSGDSKQLSASIDGLLHEVFSEGSYFTYTVASYLYTIRTLDGISTLRLGINYMESAAQTKLVEQKVREVLPQIEQGRLSDREKVRAIHDWIITHVAYDATLAHNTAYDALMSGSAVCQGYAMLADRMLQLAGFPSRIVGGSTATGNHIWNLVQVDGHWYHMDVTWDDPLPDRPGQTRDAYFLKTDEQMRVDHDWK